MLGWLMKDGGSDSPATTDRAGAGSPSTGDQDANVVTDQEQVSEDDYADPEEQTEEEKTASPAL